MNLTKIGRKYKTDKAYEHQFTKVYNHIFKDRLNIDNLLEIGVYEGNSLKMWSDYFENSEIYGLDNWTQIDEHHIKDFPRIHIITADQDNVKEMDDIVKKLDKQFDIILDDGSHRMDHQQSSFGVLFKYVKPGGYYIIEDLQSSFDWQLDRFKIKKDYSNTTYKFLNTLLDGNLIETYINKDDAEFIKKEVDDINIIDCYGDKKHITSIIRRKKE